MKASLFLWLLLAVTPVHGSEVQRKQQEDQDERRTESNANERRRNQSEIPPEKVPPSESSILEAQTQGEKPNYIVVFEDTDAASLEIAEQTTLDIVDAVGGEIKHEYKTVLKGVAASLTEEAVEELKLTEGIKYVVKDDIVSVSQELSWGLDRIDQPDLPLDNRYRFSRNTAAGAGINACVSLTRHEYVNKYNLTLQSHHEHAFTPCHIAGC